MPAVACSATIVCTSPVGLARYFQRQCASDRVGVKVWLCPASSPASSPGWYGRITMSSLIGRGTVSARRAGRLLGLRAFLPLAQQIRGLARRDRIDVESPQLVDDRIGRRREQFAL